MNSPTLQARAVTVTTGVGILVRYGFYLAGLLLFGLVALGIVAGLRWQPRLVSEEPAFRLAASDFANLPASSEIVIGGSIGRSEARHYGQLYQHGRDMTVIIVQPPEGRPLARDFTYEIAMIPTLRKARARLTSTFYDLETRFGPLRAAEMRVDIDGRRKLCFAFLSRFETPYLYMKGWICEASGAQPSAGQLACIINRIAFDRPLASTDADVFVREQLARGAFCQATPVSQTTDTRRHIPRPWRHY
jgi:hypothetical protein